MGRVCCIICLLGMLILFKDDSIVRCVGMMISVLGIRIWMWGEGV